LINKNSGERADIKIKTRYILLFAVLITIVTTIIIQLSSKEEKPFHDTVVNEKIVQAKSFSVNSDSTDLNTSAKGTVFIRGDEGMVEYIQIVASIEIDPNDWGGVAFYIPDKWYISNIISSYPENETQSIPADYVATVTNVESNSHEWRAWIEVGTDHSWRPTGGGTGTVVIDIVPDQNAIQPSETFNIGVAVGSDERNGIKVSHPDSIKVPISLTDNE
jgi:hypothetical protein